MASITGLSAEVVRGFLLQSAESSSWTVKYMQKTLGVDAAAARQVLSALSMAGYIERDPDNKDKWRNTEAGNRVAGVKAARPITRKTAEKAIAEVVERAHAVNAATQYLYRVRKILLFGPYLNGAEKLKDVDLAVDMAPKEPDAARREEMEREHAKTAAAAGKRFKSWAAQRAWPRDEVLQFLKGRSRSVALYELDEKVLQQPHKLLFEESQPEERHRPRHAHKPKAMAPKAKDR